jgi:hypothetical protein
VLSYDTNSFIKNARAVFGNRYDYSLLNIKTSRCRAAIVCEIHGQFNVRAEYHTKSPKHHCPACMKLESGLRRFTDTAISIHGPRYSYSQFQFIDHKTQSAIICPQHGEFLQSPHKHNTMKRGCPKCGLDRAKNTGKEQSAAAKANFIARAKEAHGGRYDYTLTDYTRSYLPVDITCRVHGVFQQRPDNHISKTGKGCRKCGHVQSCEKNMDPMVAGFIKRAYVFASGHVLFVQGYESYAMRILENLGYTAKDLVVSRKISEYKYNGECKSYYPDIAIESEKLVIEVKSPWTFKKEVAKNMAKRQSVIDAGYHFEFWIFDHTGKLVDVK